MFSREKDQLKEEKFDFETVHNIDEYGAEFVPTMREALKTWNMTVQYWLATIVYRRFPLRSVRTAVVMLTSAFWHGVHSGYYLSIGSCPLVLAVEDLYARVVRRKLSQRVSTVDERFFLAFYKAEKRRVTCSRNTNTTPQAEG